jgi:hypothetical protein
MSQRVTEDPDHAQALDLYEAAERELSQALPLLPETADEQRRAATALLAHASAQPKPSSQGV